MLGFFCWYWWHCFFITITNWFYFSLWFWFAELQKSKMNSSVHVAEITNLSPNATERHVYKFFSFSDAIEHIEIIRCILVAFQFVGIFHVSHSLFWIHSQIWRICFYCLCDIQWTLCTGNCCPSQCMMMMMIFRIFFSTTFIVCTHICFSGSCHCRSACVHNAPGNGKLVCDLKTGEISA